MVTSAAFLQASISDVCNNMNNANLRVGGGGGGGEGGTGRETLKFEFHRIVQCNH